MQFQWLSQNEEGSSLRYCFKINEPPPFERIEKRCLTVSAARARIALRPGEEGPKRGRLATATTTTDIITFQPTHCKRPPPINRHLSSVYFPLTVYEATMPPRAAQGAPAHLSPLSVTGFGNAKLEGKIRALLDRAVALVPAEG